MNKYFWTFTCAMTLAVMTACTDAIDNPVNPEPVNPETPEQQAFWAPFDAWQTDSCTVGDDFYMHMVGTWWKNPVDIYPNGLLRYAAKLNDQRLDDIYQSEPNLVRMKAHTNDGLTMTDDEVEQMVNAKVNELWAGATTREEALAALGRAWAEGYTLALAPSVSLVNGVPTWQLGVKLPSYLHQGQVAKSKKELWRLLAPRQNARLKTRRAQDAATDVDMIVKGMNIGLDHIELQEGLEDELQARLAGEWGTVDGIKATIEQAVRLLDGALVNDDCLAAYNSYLATALTEAGVENEVVLSRSDINHYLVKYMGNIYALNYYNQQYITPTIRQKYAQWCEKFRDVMRQRLETNTWLESETRQNAIDKLDKVVFFVGGISVIPDFVVPTLTGSTIIDDVRQLRKAQIDGYRWAATQKREDIAMLLTNLTYLIDATIDNASYMFSFNIVNINPSNLCSPYVEEDYEDALQWAFIGTTIGHELTHGFDSNGSQYDMWGNQVNWWTDADAAKFQTLCDQLADQFDHLQLMPWADPTLYGDGQNTLAENIADLGGCCLALQILLGEHPNATDAEKMALARRYFQGWAIQWSMTYDLHFVEYMKERDVHSQARERTNGIVRNVDEWYDSYDIKSGSLYLKPSERVQIW